MADRKWGRRSYGLVASAIVTATVAAGVAEAEPVPTTTQMVSVQPGQVGVGGSTLVTARVLPQAAGAVTFYVNGAPVGNTSLSGEFASAPITIPFPPGTYAVTAIYAGNEASAASEAQTPLSVQVGGFNRYFAEGATGGFFQTDIGVLTSGNLTLRLFPEGAAPILRQFPQGTLRRRSFDINAILAEEGFAGSVSTELESDQPLAATRQMTWGSPVYGSTLEDGVAGASTTWYFAEGATSIFSLFYLVQNPGATPATVTFTHLLEGGAAPVVQHETVPPFSRRTFFINDVPGINGASLSTVVTSTEPVIAERAMYLNTTSRQWEGGAAAAGATALSTNWSLAEGANGFFYTYLLLGNPSTTPATVSVTYKLADGTTVLKDYVVPAQARRTIDTRSEDQRLDNGATFGMTIASTTPIVVERAMWWGQPFYEGSVAFGSTVTATRWSIGEGAEGGPNDEAMFVLVSNEEDRFAAVDVRIWYDDGTTSTSGATGIAAGGRATLRIADLFPESVGRKFSLDVFSSFVPSRPSTGPARVTVEYSRYQSSDGFLSGGGAALATPWPQ